MNMRIITFFTLALLLVGAGCSIQLPSQTEVPTGYTKYDDGTLSFVYPNDLSVNRWGFDPSTFDFDSNIYMSHTNADEIEAYCWEEFGYRYADNPSERPIAEELTILAEQGFSHQTAKDIGTDLWDCGWAWGSYEKFPISVGEYKGIIDYGCAGDSGQCEPAWNWVNVTLVNKDLDVHMVSFRPIFGNMADRDLTMFVNTDEDWNKVSAATRAALTNGYNYNAGEPAISWFDDLTANIKTIDEIIATMQVQN